MAHSVRIVTLSRIAEEVGFSVATVSYALRNDPKIPLETREAVRLAAERLGYRPNPRVASLMHHIRVSQAQQKGERIAFIWMRTTRAEVEGDIYLQNTFEGARLRAKELGFGLEEFWTEEEGMTDSRLQQIIKARGITGVLLSPVMGEQQSISLSWDWNQFAPVVVGNMRWIPELHHSGHHHFVAMQTALSELVALGFKRPAAIVSQAVSNRSRRAFEGAFLAHHPRASQARRLIRIESGEDNFNYEAWLKTTDADVVLLCDPKALSASMLQKACAALNMKIVTLYWEPAIKGLLGAIDPCEDQIAARAVDMVVSQLNANETGTPEIPAITLFPGRWICFDDRSGHDRAPL